MTRINIEEQMGMVTNFNPSQKNTIEICLDALDIQAIVESLEQLNSQDEKFNQAIKVVSSKLTRVNLSVTAKIHVGAMAL